MRVALKGLGRAWPPARQTTFGAFGAEKSVVRTVLMHVFLAAKIDIHGNNCCLVIAEEIIN